MPKEICMFVCLAPISFSSETNTRIELKFGWNIFFKANGQPCPFKLL